MPRGAEEGATLSTVSSRQIAQHAFAADRTNGRRKHTKRVREREWESMLSRCRLASSARTAWLRLQQFQINESRSRAFASVSIGTLRMRRGRDLTRAGFDQ